ncbi:DUF481 domain-containing protein [Paracoccus sp. (in: a-proteobacteria)]|uniref:DUF481 domain-containing protein n=1 Tax=Paracoccus sp. TaxID=267 RepID=UPI00289F8FD9|nr:DUF481 domain-containing protein [Paracoccus sp. (in: a-proteobacteria)]
MNTFSKLAGATILAAATVAPAYAQQEIATGANAVGITDVNEQMRDVERDVRDDFARSEDNYRFGPGSGNEGVFGSIALSYAGRTGNEENQDFSLAGRLSQNYGQFAQSVGILLEYGEDDQGDAETKRTSVIYDAAYFFNDRFYAFALGRVATDGMAGDVDGLSDSQDYQDLDGGLKRDAFLGVGPGYRILNNDTTAWRVQAGVGIRYTKAYNVTSDANPADPLAGTGEWDSNTDVGYIVSSRFYHRFNENIFVTNDTDYLTSDVNDLITNELGVNFKMSDAFATRVSYKTEYVSDRAIRTDNTLGVSLVYGF